MGNTWEESYVGQLRQAVGHRALIIPSTRAVIVNEQGEVLFVSRRGEDSWGMPAGSIEVGESIYDCMKREVMEETGLEVLAAETVSLYSSPEFMMKNRFGDEYQMFEFVFKVTAWQGELISETDETVDAKFFAVDQLPEMGGDYWREHTERVLADVEAFQGSLILR